MATGGSRFEVRFDEPAFAEDLQHATAWGRRAGERARRNSNATGIATARLLRCQRSEQPNAFATGRNPQHAAVAVTHGLLQSLPTGQVKGVLAHEFAHIKNRDILVSSIAATVAGAIAAIAEVFQWSLFFGGSDEEDSGPLGWIGLLGTIIVAAIAASLLQLAVSRQREYLAGATGSATARSPTPLADALETLEHAAKARPMTVNPATASAWGLGCSSPWTAARPCAAGLKRPPWSTASTRSYAYTRATTSARAFFQVPLAWRPPERCSAPGWHGSSTWRSSRGETRRPFRSAHSSCAIAATLALREMRASRLSPLAPPRDDQRARWPCLR